MKEASTSVPPRSLLRLDYGLHSASWKENKKCASETDPLGWWTHGIKSVAVLGERLGHATNKDTPLLLQGSRSFPNSKKHTRRLREADDESESLSAQHIIH